MYVYVYIYIYMYIHMYTHIIHIYTPHPENSSSRILTVSTAFTRRKCQSVGMITIINKYPCA